MKCATCDASTVGKSKYCQTHRAIARQAWKANVEKSANERAERVANYEEVWREVREQASRAYIEASPTPMVVYEAVGLSSVPKPGGQSWEVAEGPCGFSWIHFPKANTSFVRWLAKQGIGRKSYYGGWDVQSWQVVNADRGQSIERKRSAMTAGAEVLRRAGIDCRADDRLD